MYIELTPTEVQIVRWIAEQREFNDKKANVVDQRITPGNGNLNINGFGGEMAFCKYFNIQPQFKVRPQAGGEDCHLMGFKVDVKTTGHLESQIMKIPDTKRLGQVDIFACVVGRLPRYNIIGYIREADALKEEYLVTNDDNKTFYVIRHSLLTPFKDRNYY